MNQRLFLVSIICLLTNILAAQEYSEVIEEMSETNPGRRRAVVLDINARVLDGEDIVSWSESDQKTTIPGTPVSIQLVGANVVVVVQFTPFIRRDGNVLVAQGQVWINDPDNGVGYFTSIQTIPMEFDEPIHFFPLGQSSELDALSSIEIILTVNPYRDAENPRGHHHQRRQ
ncbi:MAG: hypothetical protein LBC80_00255 [Treponema sp.]|jgi:hypothetical protein|nr:hypothetical protein [Treponema sp.]